ncbi:hypothetical protein ACA910_002027 [Epithemia clementina (nom. ined.)]
MSNIYQAIWNADQAANGVEPILDFEQGNDQDGYAKVNSRLDQNDPELRVITEVKIPDRKKETYELATKLFNNYALYERQEEKDTPQELQEVEDLVQAMIHTPPMKVARSLIEQETGQSFSSGIGNGSWYSLIRELWFERFKGGGDPDLTGFEHVIVGEGEASRVQGYHWWYKYYLDDGWASKIDGNVSKSDRIIYQGSKQSDGQGQYPESITLSFTWEAPDYEEKKAIRTLDKTVGGFFVGCSLEGLLALGTVRAMVPSQQVAIIEGAKYDLKLFMSSNNRHVRTFYPVFLQGGDGSTGTPNPNLPPPTPPSTTDPPPSSTSSLIRIVAALINPKGQDPGAETVTLINLGATAQSLDGWHLDDKNRQSESLNGIVMGPGDTHRVTLSGSGAQLSNKGGSIYLLDANQTTVHSVSYPSMRSRIKGQTMLFSQT